jgi:hypothetical protein
MDSPHETIDVYWPRDAQEFALRSDERFIERYETVEQLLGSNLPLPDAMSTRTSRVVDPEEMVREAEAQEVEWDGIQDAFSPVRALVEGDESLVEPGIARAYKGVSNRVLSRVSVVRSSERWAFVCIAGSAEHAPRWIYVAADGHLTTPLDDIAKSLRARLSAASESGALDAPAAAWLIEALRAVERGFVSLLPRRKRVALQELAIVVRRYSESASAEGAHELGEDLRRLARLVETREEAVDWDAVADTWLELVRPVWYERLTARRRSSRPIQLKDIRSSLLGDRALPYAEVRARFARLPKLAPIDSRVAACILGSPK